MQNIPSHATDIRHMFHATPSRNETHDCREVDDVVEVELPNVYLVETSEGEKEVQQLAEGDKVKLIHNNTEVWCSVISNQLKYLSTGCSCLLTFVAEDVS